MHEGCGESCANRWRGMLYGMTNRAGWTGHDPNNNAGVYDPQTPSCKYRAMLACRPCSGLRAMLCICRRDVADGKAGFSQVGALG